MIVKSFFLLLFCANSLSFFNTPTENEDVWENPHDSFAESKSNVIDFGTDEVDMFSGSNSELDGTEITTATKEPSPLKPPLKRAREEPNLGRGRDACSSFLSRFINIILENTGLKNYYMKPGENIKTVTIDISVTKKSLNILQKFNAGEKVHYRDLDESFVTFFKIFERNDKTNAPVDDYPDESSSTEMFSSFFFSMDYNQTIILLASIFLVVIVILILRNGLRYNSVIALFFILYYIIRVAQILWTQYEDIYAQRIIALEETLDKSGSFKIPDECFPSKTSVMRMIYFKVFTSVDPCTRYLKAKKSIFSELDFEFAISQPFYGLLLSGFIAFGDSAGKTTSSFLDHFPAPLRWFLLPLIIYCFFTAIFKTGLKEIMSLLGFRHSGISFGAQLNSGASPQGLPPPQSPQPTAPTIVNNFNFSNPLSNPLSNPPSLSLPGTSNNVSQMDSISGFRNQDSEYNYDNKLHALKWNKLRKRKVLMPLKAVKKS